MQRTLSLVIVLSALFIGVGEVVAACGWVLWANNEKFWEPRGYGWGKQSSQWSVINASSNEEDCMRKLQKQVTLAATNAATNSFAPEGEEMMQKVEDNGISISYFPKNSKPDDTVKRVQNISYVCLPDTVDPREPKR